MLESVATDIQSPTVGRDSAEGVTQDPFVTKPGVAGSGPNGDGFACSYQEPGGRAELLYGQRNAVLQPTLYFDQDPGAEVNDRIIVFSPRTGETLYFLVEVQAQAVMRGRLWEVKGQRIRAPQ